MYDVKYAPFSDSYIGMANGDTYEHLKRWLKQRLTFVDTLYDYAPSYNNDVLTIRANTTEPMTLYIETYTPVYQHLSWYNNQMDKKKIDGKIAVEFTGRAMAETDQEVLIYGGSNIKKITGISSMNPNRMLIGSATRLIELDAHDCPLLADINANKSNLAPHTYLNKLNLSNCPLLGGNLIVNNSPLLREVDISGTNITGLNLPSNVRNLEKMNLPKGITSITLHDASQLHTLNFEEGTHLDSISMSNCSSLVNTTNFDYTTASNVTFNNSYTYASELYFKDTANLSLSNLPNLEKVVYIPNNEYESFDILNVYNAPDYSITTFNCPKLNTFMTTAPYRISWNNGDYGEVKPNEVFIANTIDISNTQFTDVKLLCTTDTNVLKLPQTVKNLIVDSAYDLDTNYLIDGNYDTIHTELYEPYNTDYEEEIVLFKVSDLKINTSMFTVQGWYNSAGTLWVEGLYYSTDFIPILPNTTITNNKDVYSVIQYTKDKQYIKGYSYYPDYIYRDVVTEANCYYVKFTGHNSYGFIRTLPTWIEEAPNLIPSASDGSIIQSMYVPTKTVQPNVGVWDLKGLELEEYHTFGLNNDVKLVDNTLTMPNRYDEYSIQIKNTTIPNEIARYTASDWNTFPTFNSEFIYTYDITQLDDEVYYYSIMADSMDNLPTSISFSGKSNLLTVEYLNIDKVTNMYAMFRDCNNLTSLDVSNWDTSNVTDMSYMFYNCNKLTSLDVSNWDTSKVTNMKDMFVECTNLTSLDVSNFDTSNVTSMQYMFVECTNLTSLDVSNWDTSKVTNMSYMFYGCKSLTTLDVSNFDTSNVTNMYQMFYNCINLTSLDVSNFDTSNVTNMGNMFVNCNKLTSLDVSNFNTSKVTDMGYMFNGCNNLTSLDVSNFNTSNVTNMIAMFNGCNNLTSLDVSNFNTSNVTNMREMFYNCKSLTTLDLSNFNTSNVTDMGYMFWNCNNLTSLDISNFDTSNATNMYTMFQNCQSLTSLDVSNFDTSKVTNMQGMFYGCTNLTSLDVSNFDTSNVTTMSNMFYNCSSLQELHIDSWSLNDITQTAVSSLPVGDDEKNEIYASVSFAVPSGWSLIDTVNQIMMLSPNALANLTEEEILALTNEGWTIA